MGGVSHADPIDGLAGRLPRHARLLDALRGAVRMDARFRWLELGCSLGVGGGDEHSDADVGVGYVDIEGPDELAAEATSLAEAVGAPIEALTHRLEGWPDGVCRVAAEYPDGVQLDLVLMPAALRPGLSDRSIAVLDKDGVLATPWVPEASEPPSERLAREWLVLGWWALSDAAKYIARGSWFEAVESIGEARRHSLRLWAAGAGVPYPAFGLTSLLDFPPFDVPARLVDTYASPGDPGTVVRAAWACARLLDDGAQATSHRLDISVTTPLADSVRHRLGPREPATDAACSD